MFSLTRKAELDRLRLELLEAQSRGTDYATLQARAEAAEKALADLKTAPLLHCSFCRKNHTEVQNLFAGPHAFICDECAELCMRLILEKRQAAREARS